MRKIINSATTQYEPLLTEELVLDDRPISGSFNGITSDAVYKAISVDPGNVPPVESTDNGKVLTASYSEGGGSFEWADAPSELPDTTGASQGDVLAIGSSGLEWVTPSGGGGSSTSAFDTTFNLVNNGATWRLSNSSSSDYINLTGGAGVYAYYVVAEITDSANPTEIDDIYKVTVRIGNASASETKTIYLKSEIETYPEDPASISYNASGILNISSAQHIRGQNVYVGVVPAKGASGTAVTSFTGGSVTLYLAKLSTLSGGWEPES